MVEFLRNFFGPLTSLMGEGLQTFHSLGAPWWLSIVVLTVVVRGALFPLTFRQAKSMHRMQELKPDLDRIKKQHKGDPKKQQEATMKLYAERRVNPLGGCLPILIQMPIFITLYYTIKHFETLESFRTGGLLWFPDLTVADHLFILPVLYVLTMMASQMIATRNTAPEQKRIMRLLHIAFGFFLHRFPSGLFMYWISSNLITLVQNYLIHHRLPFVSRQEEVSEK